jgi:hypothetical protein
MESRFCKTCNTEKPIDKFPTHEGNGRRHSCRECRSKLVASWYERNRERKLAEAREKYAADPSAHWTPERRKRANERAIIQLRKLRAEVFSHYGNECVACGETEPLFLTLDHVNNDGAEMRRTVHASQNVYRWAKKNGYPDALQTLCMNCNFGKARNGGVLVRDRRLSEGSTAIPKGSTGKCPEARSPLKCESVKGDDIAWSSMKVEAASQEAVSD